MKRLGLLLCVLLTVVGLQAQTVTPAPILSGQQIQLPLSNPPIPPASVSAHVTGNAGTATYYYWVVANDPIGNSAPSKPAIAVGVPNVLDASHYVTVSWTAAPGATSYDVLRTITSQSPSGNCNCAIATGTTGTNVQDQGASLQSYTVSSFDPSAATIALVSKATGPDAESLSLEFGGTQRFAFDSASGLLVSIVNGQYYATLFSGIDIGAKINSAINSCAASCTVVVPAGIYYYATTIVKPRGVVLRGQGTDVTVLKYTGSSAAVVVGDAYGASYFARTGVRDLTISGPAKAAGSIGVFLGGDPGTNCGASACLPSADEAFGETFHDFKIVGFDRAIVWGNNAFMTSWSDGWVEGNNYGIYAPANQTDSNSTNYFSRVSFFGNASGAVYQLGATIDNQPALNFVLGDFEYNSPQTNTDTTDTTVPQVLGPISCSQCHFEEWGGPVIENKTQDSQVLCSLCTFGIDSIVSSPTPAIILLDPSATNVNGQQTVIFAPVVYGAHTVTNFINYNAASEGASGNGILSVQATHYMPSVSSLTNSMAVWPGLHLYDNNGQNTTIGGTLTVVSLRQGGINASFNSPPPVDGNCLVYSASASQFQPGSCGAAYSAQTFSNGNAQSAFPSGVTANQLSLYALEIPTSLQAAKISYWVDAGDATTTDAYSLGIYNSSGTLVAHVAPVDWQYSGTARTDALVEGTVTLPAGMYFVAITGDAATATLYSVCGAQKSFVDFASSSYAATTSGALPASITAPTLAPAQGCAPYIFLSK